MILGDSPVVAQGDVGDTGQLAVMALIARDILANAAQEQAHVFRAAMMHRNGFSGLEPMQQRIAAPAFRLVAEIDAIQRRIVRFLHLADVFLKDLHAGRAVAHDIHRNQVGRGGIAKHRIKPCHLAWRPGEQHLSPRLEQVTDFAIHEPDIGLHILGPAQFCQVRLVVNYDMPETGRSSLGDTDRLPDLKMGS